MESRSDLREPLARGAPDLPVAGAPPSFLALGTLAKKVAQLHTALLIMSVHTYKTHLVNCCRIMGPV
jgi:hypothetical protein